MDPVFLHKARGDLRHRFVAEEGEQMHPQPVAVALDVFRIALADGERLVFAHEDVGSRLEVLAAAQLARAVLETQIEIPVLGCRLGTDEVFFLGRRAMIAPGEIGRALPEAAAAAPIEMNLAAEEIVCRHTCGGWCAGIAKK
jgi:hypothetical protein